MSKIKGNERKKKPTLVKKGRKRYSDKQKRATDNGITSYGADLHLVDGESDALEIIGRYLFYCKTQDWKRCKNGESTTARVKALTLALGRRFAYAIVQRNNQQYAKQLENIEEDIKLKQAENQAIETRAEQARTWEKQHPDGLTDIGTKPTKKEYNPPTYEEWCRYQKNQSKLAQYAKDDYIGVTFGGKSNQRVAVRAIQRDPDDEDNQKIHHDWKVSRYEIYAIGDSSHACGNSVVQLQADGTLKILVPQEVREDVCQALGVEKLSSGKYMILSKPVVFNYGWDVLKENILHDKSVTNNIKYKDGKWKIISTANASAKLNETTSQLAKDGGSISAEDGSQTFASGKDNPAVKSRRAKQEEMKAIREATVVSKIDYKNFARDDSRRRFMGVDVNDGHFDIMVSDICGNPCGQAKTIEFEVEGTSKQVKSSVLHALEKIRHIAERRHVECVFMEDLHGFLDSKSRVLNLGGRNFRRIVSRIPSGEIKTWATRKLTFEGCHVEFVPAAYTSQAAKEFWDDIFESPHQAAALMIARRGLGLGLFRHRPNSPYQSSVVTGEECCEEGGLSNNVLDYEEGGRIRKAMERSEGSVSAERDIGVSPLLKEAVSCSTTSFVSGRRYRRTRRFSFQVEGEVPYADVTV